MQLYIIRHAQSENNALWYKTGSSIGRSEDPNLTVIGRQQAAELADFLDKSCEVDNPDKYDLQNARGIFLTHIYTSLMIRAVETGTVVAKKLNKPLIAWTELHEEGGIYLQDESSGERIGQPGNNRAFYRDSYPDMVVPDQIDENGWWMNRPFETEEMSRQRARDVLKELLRRHGGSNDRVAWITHGGFYNQFMAVLLDLKSRNDIWFVINNAAITRVDFESEGVAVVYLNRLDYLSRYLIT